MLSSQYTNKSMHDENFAHTPLPGYMSVSIIHVQLNKKSCAALRTIVILRLHYVK
jgi:hypothetical protein